MHLKKGNFKHDLRAPFLVEHIPCCKAQIMLEIMSMVLQSMMINEARFNNEREMNVDNGLQGSMEDENWWVYLMTWKRQRWRHRMTWRLNGWGLVARPALDVEGVKVG